MMKELDAFGLPIENYPNYDYGCIDTEREKKIIKSQIKSKAEQYEDLNKIWFEENTPKKGVITKEIWDVPIPTHKKIMMSDLDYQFLGSVILNSNNGGKANNMYGERFIYKDKLWALDDDKNIPKIAAELKISLSTFKRKVKALLNADLGVVEICINKGGDVFYKIKYATDYKYFITIKSDMLEELIASTNSNMIKIYSLMCYNLTEAVQKEDGSYEYKHIRKQMTYEYMLEQIGYAKSLNRKKVSTMLNSLRKLGFIKIYEINTPVRKIDKKTNTEKVLFVKGYEYELCTYDEWVEINKINKN